MNKRTALFGGSFDPIHKGHTSLAAEVLKNGLADEVWFLVSPMNPHKQGTTLTNEEQRLEMVRLAIKDEPRFVACDFEFTLPRPSYTITTLDALAAKYPDREFILLIGADNWEKIDKWYKHEEILARYSLIVYPREGFATKPGKMPCNVQWLASPLYTISSTELRKAISEGGETQEWLNTDVKNYITINKLYKKI